MPVTTAEAQRVGDYLLDRRIAAGACGEVWLGHHCNGTGDPVAVKVNNDPQYLRNLQKDWDALQGLRHPGIVQAVAFDPYADPPYLAMEYVPGSSLRPLIQGRKLSVSDAVAVMWQVLAALAHAHSMGIVHRDIKPENILVHERALRDGFSSEGVVKLTDFGLGRVEQLTSNSIELSTSLSGEDAQHVVGTLAYMAPEQQEGLPADARADLYACGIVFFEMLTGRKPHGAVLPSKLNPSVPRHLDKAFQRAFGWQDERYASAEEFIDALSEPTAPPGVLPAQVPDRASGPTSVAGIARADKPLRDSRGKSDSPSVLAAAAFLASFGCFLFLLLPNAADVRWLSIFDPLPAFLGKLSQEGTRISLLGILLAVYASLPRRPAACRGAALGALLINVGMLVATAPTHPPQREPNRHAVQEGDGSREGPPKVMWRDSSHAREAVLPRSLACLTIDRGGKVCSLE